jgi:5-formyltetrahydrofolate cyclo-ligase
VSEQPKPEQQPLSKLPSKAELRKKFKAYRKAIPLEQRTEWDREIILRLLSSPEYYRTNTVLTYVSSADEIGTREFIRAALANGKRVACPKCLSSSGYMDFYYINSLLDLKPGLFGVDEPDTTVCKQLVEADYSGSICIVPGLAFDITGNRLGHGKGYYDKFLINYTGISLGLCYNSCVKLKFPRDEWDVTVDIIITEKYERKNN